MATLREMLGPKTISAEEQARRDAQKALVQRESDLKNPATGFGISVKEAAYRLGVSLSTVYRWIAKGKFETARKDRSRAGGQMQYWVSGTEVYNLEGKPFRCTAAGLH